MARVYFLTILAAIVFNCSGEEWFDRGRFSWKRADTLTDGIKYTHLARTSPRLMKIWAARVDLHKKFNFHTAKKAENHGEMIPTHLHRKLVIHTKRQSTADFMTQAQQNNIPMVFAVNAAPWSPWDKIPSPYASNLGLLISDGEMVSPARAGRPSFVVYKDGKIDLRLIAPGEDISNIAQAVSGFDFVLKSGKACGSATGLAPRTGLGLSADKRFLYLVVIDGRQPFFSMGCPTLEVGKILAYFGAHDGLNMDGGGSSSFVIWDAATGKARMLNQQPGNRVRGVGASLGISLGD
ncbi:MAG: phosphodiester glycosidase family protein [Lentisphaeria bacterium]|nr:phosphodiester glycosidase family protein [Lentisphaeria bacterium]